MDYFDLYIIHFPVALKYVDPATRYPPGFFYEGEKVELSKATLQQTYEGMEELYESGLIKSLGISNYTGNLILDVERYAKVLPQTLQVEHHPYLVQQDLVNLCKDRRIAMTAYSSFGPQSFLELNMQKAKDTPLLFDHQVIKSIADKHSKTPAQVLLRWATQRDIAVIPKSNNQSRLAQNLDVCSFDLDKDEIEKISGLDKGLRFNNPLNVCSALVLHNVGLSLTRRIVRHPDPDFRIDESLAGRGLRSFVFDTIEALECIQHRERNRREPPTFDRVGCDRLAHPCLAEPSPTSLRPQPSPHTLTSLFSLACAIGIDVLPTSRAVPMTVRRLSEQVPHIYSRLRWSATR